MPKSGGRRLVLCHQANGWRSRNCPTCSPIPYRGFHPRRLHDEGCEWRSRHRHSRAGMRRRVIAIFAGVADGHRFSMMFNTYTLSASSRYSPGLILMRDIVDHYAGRGYRAIDLGIGSDEYSGCSGGATSRSSTASSRPACAAGWRRPRCRASTAPSTWSSTMRRCSRSRKGCEAPFTADNGGAM